MCLFPVVAQCQPILHRLAVGEVVVVEVGGGPAALQTVAGDYGGGEVAVVVAQEADARSSCVACQQIQASGVVAHGEGHVEIDDAVVALLYAARRLVAGHDYAALWACCGDDEAAAL